MSFLVKQCSESTCQIVGTEHPADGERSTCRHCSTSVIFRHHTNHGEWIHLRTRTAPCPVNTRAEPEDTLLTKDLLEDGGVS
jgi:hypothetical protein